MHDKADSCLKETDLPTDITWSVYIYIRSNPCSIFIQTQCSLRRHAKCILLSSNCFIFLNHFCSVLALFTPIKDTRAFNEIALVVYWGPIERRAPQWMKVLSRSFFLVSCSSSRPLREKCQLCGWFCHWSVRTPSTSPLPRQPGPPPPLPVNRDPSTSPLHSQPLLHGPPALRMP